MKRIITLFAVAAMILALVGCGAQANTPQPTAKDYTEILKNARDEESNQYDSIIGKDQDGKLILTHNPQELPAEDAKGLIDMTLDVVGLKEEQVENLALSSSLMNIRAYCVAIVKPTAGNEQAVAQALTDYRARQQQAFENYLPDQYEVTKAAKMETLKTGEVVLVMCQDAETIFNAIVQALEK